MKERVHNITSIGDQCSNDQLPHLFESQELQELLISSHQISRLALAKWNSLPRIITLPRLLPRRYSGTLFHG